jgi:hypothetical protein
VRVKRFQQPGALRARDDGLRRVRKITWRAGLLAALGAAIIGARFAHLSPSLPRLPSDHWRGARSLSCPRLALLIERAEPGRTG